MNFFWDLIIEKFVVKLELDIDHSKAMLLVVYFSRIMVSIDILTFGMKQLVIYKTGECKPTFLNGSLTHNQESKLRSENTCLKCSFFYYVHLHGYLISKERFSTQKFFLLKGTIRRSYWALKDPTQDVIGVIH